MQNTTTNKMEPKQETLKQQYIYKNGFFLILCTHMKLLFIYIISIYAVSNIYYICTEF